MIAVAAVLVLAALAFYFGVLIFNASLAAKQSPKVAMFLCDKHGSIPESVLLHLEGVTEKPFPVCPFCFKEKAETIKNIKPTRVNAE